MKENVFNLVNYALEIYFKDILKHAISIIRMADKSPTHVYKKWRAEFL